MNTDSPARPLQQVRDGLDLDVEQHGLAAERELGDRLHRGHPLLGTGEINRPQLTMHLCSDVKMFQVARFADTASTTAVAVCSGLDSRAVAWRCRHRR